MCDFSLSSKYFSNISVIGNRESLYRDKRFSIIINNNFVIELPEIVAASLSTAVTKSIETDSLSHELHIKIDCNRDITSTLDKIRRVIVNGESVNIGTDEVTIFGEFGYKIGNDDFLSPLSERFDTESLSLTKENVISVLLSRQKFGFGSTDKEIAFIASNFESLRENETLLQYSSDPDNLNVVESVIRSENLRLSCEDSLVHFLISTYNQNAENAGIIRLFDYVLLEYCTAECCEVFIAFVNEIASKTCLLPLIKCMGRRLVQPQIPLSTPFVEGRHEKSKNENINEKEINGILMKEHEKGNVVLNPSSVHSGNVYDLLDGNENNFFYTGEKENSFIEASLKNGKTFVIKNYALGRGGKSRCCPLSWRLEGQRYSDGKWITIDRQTMDRPDDGKVFSFNVSSNERLKAVRIIQEGKNTYNSYILTLFSFDISGTLYE